MTVDDSPTRTRRRPGGARPNGPLLEREQIVDVAVQLTAERGLDRVSMRQLGDRLGVTSMAIYWYVENRRALVAAVAEQVISMISVPDDDPTWDEWLTRVSLECHDVLRRHPGVADELLSTSLRPPSIEALSVAARAQLAAAGLDEDDAATELAVLGTFVLARAQVDAHIELSGGSPDGDDDSLLRPRPSAVLACGIDHIIEGIRARLGA